MTLRSRLAIVAAGIVITIAVGGFVIVRLVTATELEQVDDRLASAAPIALRFANVTDIVVLPPPDPPGRGAGGVVADQASAEDFDRSGFRFGDVYIATVYPDGTRDDRALLRGVTGTPELPGRTSAGFEDHQTVASTDGGDRWRAVLLDTPEGNQVLVAVSMAEADRTVGALRWTVAGVTGLLVVIVGLAGWWINRLGLRPIAELTDVADAIAAGDRSRRAGGAGSRTEVGHLAVAFNVMVDERQRTEDQLRRFVGDASHELRTPVASIRAFADLYRQGGLRDAEEIDDAMRRIGGEAGRMAGLVEDLLLLARLDEGRPLDRAPVDIESVLRDACTDAGATHPSRTVSVEVADGASLVVDGDDARLRQVVANLVANALAHAGPEARVTLRARSEDSSVVVEVADDGVGMRPDDSKRAFDRLWRAEEARTRVSGGAGLGLSISRAIVEAHGGSVGLASAVDAGTTVTVVLPRPSANPQVERKGS